MIKNVIFDYGDVICRFDADHMLGSFCDDPADIELMKKTIFPDWPMLDKGSIEYEDYIERTLGKLPDRLHDTVRRFFKDWYRHMPYIDETISLISELKKKNYKLYILSNAPVYFSQIISYFDIVKMFDGIVISGNLKMAKPDRPIYEYILNKYKLVPSECLFIDDRPENISGAEKCGINGIVFKDNIREIKEKLKG